MKHIFYFLAIFPLIWELIVMFNIKKIWNFLKFFKNEKANGFSSNQKSCLFFMIGYIIWNFIGFFTFQWPLFVFLFLLGIVPKYRIWVRWLDSLISFILVFFIILNAYHLKIDIFLWLKSLL